MTCGEIWAAAISACSGLAGVALGGWIAHRQEDRKAKSSATYLAHRIACSLERFAIECENQSRDYEIHANEKNPSIKFPAPPQYPDDADGWHAIDSEYAARALGFLNDIERSGISRNTDDLDGHSMSYKCEEDRGNLHDEALCIADGLRERYGLQPRSNRHLCSI
jgi:hypothetical protein